MKKSEELNEEQTEKLRILIISNLSNKDLCEFILRGINISPTKIDTNVPFVNYIGHELYISNKFDYLKKELEEIYK